jgi:hypothetical protein
MTVEFTHPASRTPLIIHAPYPEDFIRLLTIFAEGTRVESDVTKR